MKLVDLLGTQNEEEFDNFDLTEIKEVLFSLQETDVIDIAHAELLQQKALRGADILVEYIGKLIKTVGYLDSQVNKTKNNASLNFKNSNGAKVTADQRRFAGEASPEVEELQIKLAKAKAAKSVLDRKYEILLKAHHHYKDIATGLRKTILGQQPHIPEGY